MCPILEQVDGVTAACQYGPKKKTGQFDQDRYDGINIANKLTQPRKSNYCVGKATERGQNKCFVISQMSAFIPT